ncbi:MAG: DMT family transporter [Clostridium sp.]|nr:DMT family transporter [Clostridium sp.]
MDTPSDKRFLQANAAMFLANIAWGVMSPVSKDLLLGGEISALGLSALRIAGGALLFLLFSTLLPSSVAPRERIDRGDWWKLLLCSVLMVSANQGLFILGIGYTNPVDSSVMSSLTPLLTMVLSALILGFPMTGPKITGVVLGLIGVVVLVTTGTAGSHASNPLLGNTLCFAAQVCAAVYYVVFRDLIRKYSAMTMMKWMFLLSAVTYVPLCLPWLTDIDFAALRLAACVELGYIILFGTFLSYLAIPFAQRWLKPTMVSIYNYFQPVFAAIVAVALGVGSFGLVKIAATLLIFTGVYFVNKGSSDRK